MTTQTPTIPKDILDEIRTQAKNYVATGGTFDDEGYYRRGAIWMYSSKVVPLEKEIERLKGLIETAYLSAYNKGYMDCRDKVENKTNPFDQFKTDNNL